MLRPNEIVINDVNYHLHMEVQVDGERKARGLISRDYNTHPLGCYGSAVPHYAVDFPLIPRAEWSERLKQKIATNSLLSDIRLSGNNGGLIPSLDQNGRGYCWAHSSTSCVMILRAVNNQPYVGLSAYAIACLVKNYRDEGGWGAQSLDFITSRGVPSEQFWPMKSVNRANDNANTWANAALHKVTEGFIDLQAAQYDRKLSFEQVITCLLSGIPVVVDLNWWSHSVAALDPVEGASDNLRGDSGKLVAQLPYSDDLEVTGGFGIRIWNSWSDAWSDRGMGVLAGGKAIPDGAVAPRVTSASPV